MIFSQFYPALVMFLFASAATAGPTPRNAYALAITYPTNGTVWTIGESRTVTWNVTSYPTHINNFATNVTTVGNSTTTIGNNTNSASSSNSTSSTNSTLPTNSTGPLTGSLMLRQGGVTTKHMLGSNFSLLDGKHTIQVPFVINGSDFQLVLYDSSLILSQNETTSGNFTILSDVAF